MRIMKLSNKTIMKRDREEKTDLQDLNLTYARGEGKQGYMEQTWVYVKIRGAKTRDKIQTCKLQDFVDNFSSV